MSKIKYGKETDVVKIKITQSSCECKDEKKEESWFKQMFERMTGIPITKSTIVVDNCDCGCDDECVDDDCGCKK